MQKYDKSFQIRSRPFELPRLNTAPPNDFPYILIPHTLNHISEEIGTQARILRTHTFNLLRIPTQTRRQRPRRNTPYLYAIFFQNPVPLPRHHIHARLAGSISRHCKQFLLRPPFPPRLIHPDRRVSLSLSVDVPLVMKMSLGFEGFRSKGTKL